MNRFAWAVVALSCAAPLGAEDVKVFTPSRTGDAPVYMNGEIVRIDRAAGTVTVRGSDGTRRVMTMDRASLDASASLRPGSNVIVGFRTSGSGATERHVVSDIRAGAPIANRRISTLASSTTSAPHSIGIAQVVSVDAAGRRLTVIDSTGATRVLDVRGSAVANLGGLNPGDQITLKVAAPLVSGSPAGTITSIGAAGPGTNTPRESTNAAGRIGSSSTTVNNSGTGTESTSGSNSTSGTNTTSGTNMGGTTNPGTGTGRQPIDPPGFNPRAGSGTTTNTTNPTFTNNSLPTAPGLPASPPSGVSRNPGQTGVQPAPQAQPVPGVQGPTGVQPVPGAQPLPGTGVTGKNAANPGLQPQPVPGAGGQNGTNVGGGTGTAVGGGTGAVPQLGGIATSSINSQIPSIPPAAVGATGPVLPTASISPETSPARTPAEVAMMRELGSRDFEAAIAVIAMKAAETDRAWVSYRSSCVTTTTSLSNRGREWFGILDGSITGPTADDCEQSFANVATLARSVAAGLDTARDAARRADVLPGRMREALQRYNLDI